MATLEETLEERFQKLNVSEENKYKAMAHLGRLQRYHLPTYDHCIRVGLKSGDAANITGFNPEIMFMSGILHDVGKLYVPVYVLDKNGGFGKQDYEIMHRHPADGYDMLKNEFPLEAQIIVRHHRFRKRPYPAVLPARGNYNSREICRHAKLLGIIDFYDAMITRHDRYELKGNSNKEHLLAENKGMEEMIEMLFKAKILK